MNALDWFFVAIGVVAGAVLIVGLMRVVVRVTIERAVGRALNL